MNILYLAKAGYGGWASFTAHLAHSTGWPIYKITQKGEKKKRNFGWGLGYQNLNIEQAEKKVFPLSTGDFLKICSPSERLGQEIKRVRNAWLDSNFQLERAELLKYLKSPEED